jgi:stage IV sporulation protein FB
MRIGRFFDIDIHISKYFLLLVAVILIMGRGANYTALFFILLIHEMSHVLMARLLKLKVAEIELLPFGGAVKIHSLFEMNPLHEILVAAAGPLSNILMLLFYLGGIQLGWFDINTPDPSIVNSNLMLAGFNLLPALPLDGGRILRAGLASQMGIKRATQIATTMGILLALVLATVGIYGLYYRVFNYSLFVLAGFLVYSASKERRNATYVMLKDITYKKESLLKEGSLPVRNIAVISSLPLKDVVKRFTPKNYHYVQVLDEQLKEKGSLNESQIVNGLLDYGANTPVGKLLWKI